MSFTVFSKIEQVNDPDIYRKLLKQAVGKVGPDEQVLCAYFSKYTFKDKKVAPVFLIGNVPGGVTKAVRGPGVVYVTGMCKLDKNGDLEVTPDKEGGVAVGALRKAMKFAAVASPRVVIPGDPGNDLADDEEESEGGDTPVIQNRVEVGENTPPRKETKKEQADDETEEEFNERMREERRREMLDSSEEFHEETMREFDDSLDEQSEEMQSLMEIFLDDLSAIEDGDESDEGDETSSALAGLISQHLQAVKDEAKVFKGLRWMDDVLAIKDSGSRKKALENIGKVVADVSERKDDFIYVLGQFAATVGEDEEKKSLLANAKTVLANFTNHIPDAWLDESNLDLRLDRLVKLAGFSEEQRKEVVRRSLEISEEDLQEEGGVFREAIEQGSLKGMERTRFYFDVPVLPITPEQQRKLMEVNKKIIARATLIHDAGGSVAEVEKSLAHVPPEFWPPQFIEQIQAWRRTERELVEERVKGMFASPAAVDRFDQLVKGLGTAGDLGNFVSDAVTSIEQTKSIPGFDALSKLPIFVDAMKTFHDQCKNAFGLGPDYAKALATNDFSDPNVDPEKLLKAMSDAALFLTNVAKNAAEGIKMAGSASVDVMATVSHVIPILGVVAAGIEFGQVAYELGKHAARRGKIVNLAENAEMQHLTGISHDGGGLAAAFRNARAANTRKISKETVNLVAKGMKVTGATLSTVGAFTAGADFGGMQIAAITLNVTSKGIEYGNKAVFAGIDWGIAKNALALIKEAQAGNPVARLQIMEDCGFYAKMYIAIKAKDGDPMAVSYIVDRGYTEDDLARPALALKVLREAMLKEDDQKNELKTNTSLAGAITDDVIGGLKKFTYAVGDAIGGVAGKLKDKILDSTKTKTDYDENWVLSIVPELDAASWNHAKGQAVQNGLYEESTGVGAALEKAGKDLAAATRLLDALENENDPVKRKKAAAEAKKASVSADTSLAEASSAASGFHPITWDKKLHAGMADYVARLRTRLMTERNRLSTRLRDPAIGIVNADWTTSSTNLESASWQSNWSNAVENCGVPSDDAGVAKALKAYEKTQVDFSKLDKRAARVARVKQRDSLAVLAFALSTCRKQCAEFPGLLDYLDDLMDKTVTASRDMDKEVAEVAWPDNPSKPLVSVCFSEAIWKSTFQSARAEGFIEKEGGMGAALAGYAAELEKYKRVVSPTDRIKALPKVLAKIGKVRKIADSLAAANPDTHQELADYFVFLRKTAVLRVEELRKEHRVIKYGAVLGTTKAAWKDSYKAAVAAGAVTKADSDAGKLADSMDSFDKHFKALGLTSKYKERQKEAFKCREHVQKIIFTASKLSGRPGFANDLMQSQLTAYIDHFASQLKTGLLGDVIAGKGQGTVPDTKFAPDPKAWDTFRDLCVEAGLLPEGNLDFSPLISNVRAARKNWDKVKLALATYQSQLDSDPTSEKKQKAVERFTQELREARDQLLDAGNALNKGAKKLAKDAAGGAADYLKSVEDWFRDIIVEITTDL